MNDAARARAIAAKPLDEQSRRLVPAALSSREARAEPTAKREQDLATTEPDAFGNDSLQRVRDSVLQSLNRRAQGSQEPTPGLRLVEDRPTQPVRDGAAASDVFAPVGAQVRVLDPDGATPRDRPVRHIDHDKPTDVDRMRGEPTTKTFYGPPRSADNVRRPVLHERPPHERDTERERALMKSVHESERAYHAYKNVEPERAARVERLRDGLKKSDAFSSRDLLLGVHARERRSLQTIKDPREHREREIRVLALGLIARDLDDKYRSQMKEWREQLVDEVKTLDDDKRQAVFAEFDSFVADDKSNDSHYCRRELHRALKDEQDLHRAYIYALALEKQRASRPSTDEAARSVSGEKSASSRRP